MTKDTGPTSYMSSSSGIICGCSMFNLTVANIKYVVLVIDAVNLK